MTDHELMNEIRDRDHEEFEETCRFEFEQAEEEAKETHRSRLCKCGSGDLSRPDIMKAYDTDEAI